MFPELHLMIARITSLNCLRACWYGGQVGMKNICCESMFVTVHSAESETFATLKIRQLFEFFHLYISNKNDTRNIYHVRDNDMKFLINFFFKIFSYLRGHNPLKYG